jgi:hypothetical protein
MTVTSRERVGVMMRGWGGGMQYNQDIYVELHCNKWKREERTRQFRRGEERRGVEVVSEGAAYLSRYTAALPLSPYSLLKQSPSSSLFLAIDLRYSRDSKIRDSECNSASYHPCLLEHF